MASEGSTQALIKRRNDEIALMPPPSVKRIKRPTEVLDEDDYTDALSDIISRDYYPGLREAKAQEEYLSALDSRNPEWIQEAARKLQATTNGEVEVRNIQSDTPRSYRQAGETPKNPTGADTPVSISTVDVDLQTDNAESEARYQHKPDTTTLSLSAYQSKYTSEDNASFNTVLDKQNNNRRQKHSYLWTPSQRLLKPLQIEHRKTQQKLLTDNNTTNHLTHLTTGATPSRPAAPTFKRPTSPTNNLMFYPTTSVDELGLQTTTDLKQTLSKAGPKEIVHANTRFPPTGPRFSAADEDYEDDTTSIHTSFIARRNFRRSMDADTDINTTTEFNGSGSETPRVNGYPFVDEDPPSPPPPSIANSLLTLPVTTQSPNPFHIPPSRPRESLHRKLVDQDSEKKRVKQKEIVKGRGDGKDAGNMTPAARKLLGRLGGGGTPVAMGRDGGGGARREDWTPIVTPRRERVVGKGR